MSVSTRISIAWPPVYPPQETTDTIVFTFPSNYTIDLRFKKDDYERRTLDWGFAGRVVVEGDKITFVHHVDSQNPSDPLSVQDSGVFSILPNGDELETGEMLHPGTRKVMTYEEIWRKLPMAGTPIDVICLESVGGLEDKAFIGQIGKWFQGISVRGRTIATVRRIKRDGKWEEVYSSGEDMRELPSFDPTIGKEWNAGQEVQFGNRTWYVRDCLLQT